MTKRRSLILYWKLCPRNFFLLCFYLLNKRFLFASSTKKYSKHFVSFRCWNVCVGGMYVGNFHNPSFSLLWVVWVGDINLKSLFVYLLQKPGDRIDSMTQQVCFKRGRTNLKRSSLSSCFKDEILSLSSHATGWFLCYFNELFVATLEFFFTVFWK